MEQVRQGNDSTLTYIRKYNELVDLAYGSGAKSGTEERLLVRCFLLGLKDREMARRITENQKDTTLKICQDYLEQKMAGKERAIQLFGNDKSDKRNIEPMDCSALEATTDKFTKALEQLTTKIAKIEARLDQPQGAARQPDRRTPVPSGKNNLLTQTCHYCHKVGHIKRECRKLQYDKSRQNSRHLNSYRQ